MRQGNPNGTAAGEKFDVDSVGMPRGDGHDQRLVDAVEPLARPAVGNMKVLIHGH
jgi:hypothetical protein